MKINQILSRNFDQIYIINLPDRRDRRTEVSKQFLSVGLDIDGERIRFFDAIRPENKCDFPSIGARGCFLSHLRILEDAVSREKMSVLICEDDLDFAKGLSAQDLSWGPTMENIGWSVFYGGYQKLSDTTVARVRDGLSEVPSGEGIVTTHCLGLRGSAIRECAEYMRLMLARSSGDPDGGPMHVDGAYSWFRKAHPQYATIATVPPIGMQRASKSDIAALAWYDRIQCIKPVTGALRRLKRHF